MWMEKEKGRRRMKKKREIDEKGACRSIRTRRRSRWSLLYTATDDTRYKHCSGSEEKRSRKLNMSCLGDECSSC